MAIIRKPLCVGCHKRLVEIADVRNRRCDKCQRKVADTQSSPPAPSPAEGTPDGL